MAARGNLIKHYFNKKYKYREIKAILNHKHGWGVSYRHLNRLIKTLDLHRYGHNSSLDDVVSFICDQVKRSGRCNGYRFMHKQMFKRWTQGNSRHSYDGIAVDRSRRSTISTCQKISPKKILWQRAPQNLACR